MDVSTLDFPEWVRWLAQDQSGAWWGYECEPLQFDSGWYENEVGRRLKLVSTKNIPEKENPDWRLTLQKINQE
jgi:hypothetical protein